MDTKASTSPPQKPRLIWLNISVFTLTFLIAVIGTPLWAWHHGFDWMQITALIVAFSFCGLSITAGYHRLWAHKTYQAHPALRFIFAIGGAFALQNSALHWSSDHRIHHRHVDDNDVDPYSAKRGFWFSHLGWMLREYHPNRYGDYSNCRDLQKDKIVMWQHKHYLALTLATNFGFPIAFGLLHGDLWGAILLVGFTRLVLSHHTTFFINSLAHVWGSQPYTDKNTARDNGVLALMTFGEGYHNFHHIFENDYRNGIRWWQFDPTKWLIKTASWLGLAEKLRVTPEEKIEKARATMQLQRITQQLSDKPHASHRLQILQQEYDALVAKMADYYTLKKQLLALERDKLREKVENAELTQQYQDLKVRFQQQKRSWQVLTAKYAS
ncbi:MULTISPECIES: fatty acid desaturase [unclassified Salinivibrio]|uniref:acyl-CoA desaturase n=1 Tax=unclassified Salinivibrio TaxID=2636825 RepID=UPI00128CD4D9|nr:MULTISPECIES: fatty acid desaturase [unclassified Salinivibrio]MPS31180.1 acyl-CoA desaturase [Salinivibrio sp. VYel7]MPX89283.1 acyl-CoA desaturase [Salinivibrio sp. VYel1]MPX92580.1 acyl-CoA desaturase [Salinivibrio sp. VYel9]MPX96922.1 acyl-CoA desaturase [Salinivibrio sp. VYel6]MPX98812.1 acyl-CoA desaturase [Salinivibrio sp. VYel4]